MPTPAPSAEPGIDRATSAYAAALAGDGGRALRTLRRADGQRQLAVGLYASPPYSVQVPPLALARLSINLSGARVSGGLDGDRPRQYLARRHSLFLTPAGAAAAWSKDLPSRHINIYFDRSLLHPHDDAAAQTPLFNATLPGGRALLDMLAAELSGSEPFTDEAVDGLAWLILVQLARRQRQQRTRNQPLTPARMALLKEFVAAHLDQRLLVADLAAAVGLPPNRFAQAFVACTGRPVHQFVLAERLQRASDLLLQTRQPLAGIAVACGFASQQHMTRWMHRRLGITPARLRASGLVSEAGAAACVPTPGGQTGSDCSRDRQDACGLRGSSARPS